MPARAGEPAWNTGTFICQTCNAKVRVRKGQIIPRCPNGHATFDQRVAEPKGEAPLRAKPAAGKRAAPRAQAAKQARAPKGKKKSPQRRPKKR